VFLEFCIQFGLYQFVDSPTRENHILDLVLSSDHNIMSDLHISNPFSTSDHAMVEFSLIVAQHEIRNVELALCTTTTTLISMVLYIICQMTVFFVLSQH